MKVDVHKLFIQDEIQALLAEFSAETRSLLLAKHTQTVLAETLFGGKVVRGSLLCKTYQILTQSERIPKVVYRAAAALEIFATALLVHDDVMDRDRVRRGKPSVFALYEQAGEQSGAQEATHYGYSQALLIGDICFFWVQKILSQLDTSTTKRVELQAILAKESIRTGFGQMLDIDATMLGSALQQSEVESIALNKTARYTFVLPFLLGAALAEADDQTKEKLEALGNTLGTLFQIKDDELGLFGTETETGKPEGNDVKEGKQTLYALFTREMTSDHDRDIFTKLYGTNVTAQELEIVRKIVESSGAFDSVQAILGEYAQKSRRLISELPISDDDKAELVDFVQFNLQRRR